MPPWLPCCLQLDLNGKNWPAVSMRKQRIEFTLLDNAFVMVADQARAQQIADGRQSEQLHPPSWIRLRTASRRFIASSAWSIVGPLTFVPRQNQGLSHALPATNGLPGRILPPVNHRSFVGMYLPVTAITRLYSLGVGDCSTAPAWLTRGFTL